MSVTFDTRILIRVKSCTTESLVGGLILRRIDDPVEADAHRRVVWRAMGTHTASRWQRVLRLPGMFVIDDRQKFQQLNMRPLGVGPVTVEVRLQGATPGRHIDETRKYKMTGLAHSIEVEVI